MEKYLLLGYIIGSHGLDGTLKVISKTYFASQRYEKGKKVFLHSEQKHIDVESEVISYSEQGQNVLLKLNNINTKEEAESYKSYEILALKNEVILEKGQYLFDDLVGCEVINQNNVIIGKVSVVEEFPAQLTLRIKRTNKDDVLIPFVKAFINDVDIDKKIINVTTIEGML